MLLSQSIDSSLIVNLKNHIYFLASDKLEGRQTGSKGEAAASKYIMSNYKKLALEPMGSNGSYLQEFKYDVGKKTTGKNTLTINAKTIVLNVEYFPINASGNGKVKGSIVDVGYGISASAIKYDSYSGMTDIKGKIFLMECSTPDGDSPHSQYGPYADVKSKVEAAKAKGAIAVIFTNTNDKADDLEANLDRKSFDAGIPVIFLKADAWKKVKREQFNVLELRVTLEKITVTGHNVVAFLDNHATNTILIGAHYDHLGYNEYGGSLYRGEKAIHNGADDNASGTAGVIELARFFSSNNITEKNNFIFLNFSGEELGLVGSKNWIANPTYDSSKINFMVNMDMIGRYNAEKGMEIGGLGTSPVAFEFIRSFSFDSLKLKLTDGGTGPSDETSFYLANIPVLNFFTGSHEDYHKPSDDADKVNYAGEAKILRMIENIVLQVDGKGVLPFSKTKQTDNGDVPEFKVKLGIIPDYLYECEGL
ncbi:MAG: M28 family peptidase, partial [Chitinophagales bacterium]|nr:M28 family peptidase [Chitinophagales bacterium]